MKNAAHEARRHRRSAIALAVTVVVLYLAVVNRWPPSELSLHAAAFGLERATEGMNSLATMPWENIGRSWADAFNAPIRAIWSLITG